MFMTMGALTLGTTLQIFISDDAADLEERQWVWERYGTALRASYTMYELTFAGNWPTNARPIIENVSPWFAIFFLGYITIIVFALIRVISALFLKDTLDAAQNDAEHAVVDRLKKKGEYVQKLEHLFQAIDEEGNGMISEAKLSRVLQHPNVKAYLETLDLNFRESAALFHLLDNGDGEVTLAEFIDGIMHCKGPARAIDQVAMHADLRQLIHRLDGIWQKVGRKANTTKDKQKAFRKQAAYLKTFRLDAADQGADMFQMWVSTEYAFRTV